MTCRPAVGGAIKACFSPNPQTPFCQSLSSSAECSRRIRTHRLKDKKQSTLADQQLANPAITRKENKSYRMSDIQNLKTFDPFKGDDRLPAGTDVHIRIQQRNGRKTLTTVQGIDANYDKKKLVKAFKRKFACNGTVIDHPEYGEVIQVQGDQRNNIRQFIKEVGLASDEQLKVHGF
ncbi:Eukaryotic translation initiation factor 1 [Takifugu flavidus]|nr:Eukaryotic translation initiation factor 1 [Takifugu flavidus]|eukprot:XP_003976434.2 PREDICTED: eukaryotic translation initiation factor 1-like [Takifugu rubripes]